jgi:ribosome-associated translation inhibitor RaiA
MDLPLQITFRGMSPMPSIGSLIVKRVGRLARFADRINRCHVVVDLPHRHHRNGRHYSVHIDITTSRGSIVVTRNPGASLPRELDVMIRDAFDAATRQIENETARRRSA